MTELIRTRLASAARIRALAAALVALSVVGAQIAGVTHRVEHAGPRDTPANHAALADLHADDSHQHESEHDCGAYDAAAIADEPPNADSYRDAIQPSKTPTAIRLVADADRSPQLPFHSRAPPRA